MLLKYRERFFRQKSPEVLSELEELQIKCDKLEFNYHREVLKNNQVVKNNKCLFKKVKDYHRCFQRLKISFECALTEMPSFEKYAACMESKAAEIEHLSDLVHELSFQNSELKQDLEQSKLQVQYQFDQKLPGEEPLSANFG